MRTELILLRRAFFASWDDGLLGIAKGAAYSGLLSFFPVLASAAAILVQMKAAEVSEILFRFVFRVVPPGTEQMVAQPFTIQGARPVSLLVTAGLVSVWAASGFMISLMEGFDAAYRVPSGRSIVKQRLVALLLVFAAAFPWLAAATVVVMGNRSERFVLGWLGFVEAEMLQASVSFVARLLRILVVLATVALVNLLLYYIGPNRPQRWRGIWPGAVISTLLWLALTYVFGWYVRNLANYNVLYGSIAGVIALLVWMYLVSLIVLYGCESNAERERLRAA